MTRTRMLAALAALVLLAFAVLVWPTPYRAITVHVTGGEAAARQNRFTGKVEWLVRGDAEFH